MAKKMSRAKAIRPELVFLSRGKKQAELVFMGKEGKPIRIGGPPKEKSEMGPPKVRKITIEQEGVVRSRMIEGEGGDVYRSFSQPSNIIFPPGIGKGYVESATLQQAKNVPKLCRKILEGYGIEKGEIPEGIHLLTLNVVESLPKGAKTIEEVEAGGEDPESTIHSGMLWESTDAKKAYVAKNVPEALKPHFGDKIMLIHEPGEKKGTFNVHIILGILGKTGLEYNRGLVDMVHSLIKRHQSKEK